MAPIKFSNARTLKFYTLDVNGKHKIISLDRLKGENIVPVSSPRTSLPFPSSVVSDTFQPAAASPATSPSLTASPRVDLRPTRSGRHLHCPGGT